MAHVKSFSMGACGHMFQHYDRTAKNNGNEDIDKTRTGQNYNLAKDDQPLGQLEFLKKRLSEVYHINRSDINVMSSWVITLPRETQQKDKERDDFQPFPASREDEFFQKCYEFLRDRYGKENIISCYVHRDESKNGQPHMHFCFCPVVYDKKKERFKFSSKALLNRTELRRFHSELSEFLTKELGIPVPVINSATIDGNKSIKELKRNSAAQRLKEIKQKDQDATQRLETAKQQEQKINKVIAMKNHIIEESETSHPRRRKVKKRFFTGRKYVNVPLSELEELDQKARTTEAFRKEIKAFSKTNIYKELQNLEDIQSELFSARRENFIQSQRIVELEQENKELHERLHNIERTPKSKEQAER